MAGAGTGFAGLLVGGLAGAIISDDLFGGAAVGGYLGLTIGVPIGVHLAGSYGNQNGSFAATVLGSITPSAIGVGLFAAGAYLDNVSCSDLDGTCTGRTYPIWLAVAGATVMFAGPPIGSIIGFNMTRRYDATSRLSWAPHVTATQELTLVGVAGSF